MYRLEWRSRRAVVAKVQYFDIVVSEFELQSSYYVHFRTNNEPPL